MSDLIQDQDVDALLDQASRPTATYKLCLRDDLRRQHRELEEQLVEARKDSNGTMAANAQASRLAEQIVALEKEMDAGALQLMLQALPRGRYRALVREHPPRPNDPVDRQQGVNVDEFVPKLLKLSVTRPKLTDQQLQRAMDACGDGQLMSWATACMELNQDAQSVPFSLAASNVMRPSDDD